jgi:hypothetical protein
MDDERFDLLTKVLGDQARSRRAVVSVVAGGALGAVLWLRGVEEVSAKKRKKCPRGTRKCGTIKKKHGRKKIKCCRIVPEIPASANPDPICAGTPSCCSTKQCGEGCNCQTTIEGGGFCYKLGAPACGASCTSSADCPDGVCVFYGTDTTCNENHCCEDRPAVCVPNSSRCDAPSTCVSQSTCGPNCKCFFDVDDALACYDLSGQLTCCDTNAECGEGAGCVKGACNSGEKAGACFSLCSP